MDMDIKESRRDDQSGGIEYRKVGNIAVTERPDLPATNYNVGNSIDASRRIGDKIGRLVGAQPDQVIVTDSTSVNLFKQVVAALHVQRGRTRIVSDVFNLTTLSPKSVRPL